MSLNVVTIVVCIVNCVTLNLFSEQNCTNEGSVVCSSKVKCADFLRSLFIDIGSGQ